MIGVWCHGHNISIYILCCLNIINPFAHLYNIIRKRKCILSDMYMYTAHRPEKFCRLKLPTARRLDAREKNNRKRNKIASGLIPLLLATYTECTHLRGGCLLLFLALLRLSELVEYIAIVSSPSLFRLLCFLDRLRRLGYKHGMAMPCVYGA